jgi:hypothetical protein
LLHISTGSGIGIVGILIAITLPVGQCLVENYQAEIGHKETNVKIAVGILGEKAPKDKEGNREQFSEGEKELRKWALRQLNRYTDQGDQINGDAAEALITGTSKISTGYGTYGYDGYYHGGGFTTYESGVEGVSKETRPNGKVRKPEPSMEK